METGIAVLETGIAEMETGTAAMETGTGLVETEPAWWPSSIHIQNIDNKKICTFSLVIFWLGPPKILFSDFPTYPRISAYPKLVIAFL
jgi:hypothetical protein